MAVSTGKYNFFTCDVEYVHDRREDSPIVSKLGWEASSEHADGLQIDAY